VVLQAEERYREHAPSKVALQSFFLRLWTGSDPPQHWTEIAADPAAALPPHGIKGFEPQHKHHATEATLFQEEDLVPWIVFTLVFTVLVVFDNGVLHRKAEKLSLLQSILYTTFWIAIAGMFNVYVYMTRGADDAFNWGTGYLLEWMLSVDNLFVFHRIFIVFKTPDEQKHKPLFYGIIGAIVFRMVFFLIEEILLHQVAWMHLVFGIFLIYTGYKAVSMDDEEDSPEQGWLFKFLVTYINYVDRYDEKGRFFTPIEEVVEVDEDTGSKLENNKEADASKEGHEQLVVNTGVQYRATRLVLVVVCLEVTDLIFAVDSVSAIVAQIPDLFLAYTACVFAMLGLRAMFFAIDELVKMFSLLSYGVAFILIFIGIKLILRSWIHIPPSIVCCILVSTLVISVIASLLLTPDDEDDAQDPEDTVSARGRGHAVPLSARIRGSTVAQTWP